MSRQNKVNPNHYTMAGRLTPDDLARERKQQAGVRGGSRRSKPMAPWMSRDTPQGTADKRADAEFDLAASEGAPLPKPAEEWPAEPAKDAPRAAKKAARDAAQKTARKSSPANALQDVSQPGDAGTSPTVGKKTAPGQKAAGARKIAGARKSAPAPKARAGATGVARKTAPARKAPARKTARKTAVSARGASPQRAGRPGAHTGRAKGSGTTRRAQKKR